MDSIVIQSTPTPAPAGHEAAMAAKVDAATAAAAAAAAPVVPAVEAPKRPEGVPEKFWDAEKGVVNTEALLKSYGELEAKQGTAPKEPVVAPVVAPVVPPKDGEADPAAAAAASAGLDLSALETEYRTDGKVSDESLAKLKAAGFSENDVKTYIAGREALVAQFETAVLEAVPGGADKYPEMMAWAKANLTDAEAAAYNKAMESGDVASAKLAVAGLGVKFTAAVGNEPNLVGGRVTADAGDAYESMAQVTEAMKDPKYAKDPAYRAQVQAKLGRSKL